jgi:uncharacterized protein YggU (UPF0235/DUF167 family)
VTGRRPFAARPNGVLIAIRLTPRASRDGIDGLKDSSHGPHIQARVRAVPEDDRANVALVELVAREIGVPKSTVSIVAGQTRRLKSVHVAGDAAALEQRVAAWLKRFE